MPTDIERGHKTEIDSLSGFITQEGAHLNIPTPMNKAIYEMVKELEAGTRPPGSQNLKELLPLLD